SGVEPPPAFERGLVDVGRDVPAAGGGVPARAEPLGGVLVVVGHVDVLAPAAGATRRRSVRLRAVGSGAGGPRVVFERRVELLGVGADAFDHGGEVVAGPLVAGVGDRVGLAHEAGDPGAGGDPRGQAVEVGEVERLLGGDAQPGAGVGVVADHGR